MVSRAEVSSYSFNAALKKKNVLKKKKGFFRPVLKAVLKIPAFFSHFPPLLAANDRPSFSTTLSALVA